MSSTTNTPLLPRDRRRVTLSDLCRQTEPGPSFRCDLSSSGPTVVFSFIHTFRLATRRTYQGQIKGSSGNFGKIRIIGDSTFAWSLTCLILFLTPAAVLMRWIYCGLWNLFLLPSPSNNGHPVAFEIYSFFRALLAMDAWNYYTNLQS